MLEKIKNFYGSHPIRWTLLTLVIVVAVCLLVYFAPAFSMEARLPAKLYSWMVPRPAMSRKTK